MYNSKSTIKLPFILLFLFFITFCTLCTGTKYTNFFFFLEKNRVVFAFYPVPAGCTRVQCTQYYYVYMSCTCDFMYYIPGTTTTCSPYTALLTHTAWHSMNHLHLTSNSNACVSSSVPSPCDALLKSLASFPHFGSLNFCMASLAAPPTATQAV